MLFNETNITFSKKAQTIISTVQDAELSSQPAKWNDTRYKVTFIDGTVYCSDSKADILDHVRSYDADDYAEVFANAEVKEAEETLRSETLADLAADEDFQAELAANLADDEPKSVSDKIVEFIKAQGNVNYDQLVKDEEKRKEAIAAAQAELAGLDKFALHEIIMLSIEAGVPIVSAAEVAFAKSIVFGHDERMKEKDLQIASQQAIIDDMSKELAELHEQIRKNDPLKKQFSIIGRHF